jgi:hypothetical protein
MSEHDEITDLVTEHIGKNIDLAFRLMQEIIDNPALAAEIPNGATLVMLPPDDPDLARANIELAERLAREGRDVYLQRVGGPPGRRATSKFVVGR